MLGLQSSYILYFAKHCAHKFVLSSYKLTITFTQHSFLIYYSKRIFGPYQYFDMSNLSHGTVLFFGKHAKALRVDWIEGETEIRATMKPASSRCGYSPRRKLGRACHTGGKKQRPSPMRPFPDHWQPYSVRDLPKLNLTGYPTGKQWAPLSLHAGTHGRSTLFIVSTS
jgi:hypothetical protein